MPTRKATPNRWIRRMVQDARFKIRKKGASKPIVAELVRKMDRASVLLAIQAFEERVELLPKTKRAKIQELFGRMVQVMEKERAGIPMAQANSYWNSVRREVIGVFGSKKKADDFMELYRASEKEVEESFKPKKREWN